ncbi:carbohydrate ABC transporter membrane protein 1, CUT1 family (TC 3.A.1.1.-) [Stackebrandtia albiflava]|uniref:Carbohydrate ABC transporter membrane protein 1, CUT1 family (TC 3.A.1.1.-) n=1 Tax=Stackebrandtia albiflava TaxID=406432 RepID=A0A562VE96_9ACTN|nr:sugar ABC transporter permease [Stackebrandtia albiflava]TWJ16137.1 carbohydrate ABC transporter membrane protein 1, CUT1 family (TC 3.A.1.1.-) [Stackebrandtia albiflava]
MTTLNGSSPATAPTASKRSRRGSLAKSRRRQAWAAWFFLSPTLLFFGIFLVLPLLFAIGLSLSVWGGFDLTRIEFTGLDNFGAILSEGSSFVAPILTNTLLFAFGAVALALVASVAIAHAITRLRFEGFWRTLYFLPIVTTVVAVGNIWKYLYEPGGGLINGLLNAVGISSVQFLSDPDTALPSVVVVQAWASIGSAILILTAGLKAIPHTYYEAGELDGTTAWSAFWHITLPLLRPTLLFVMITQFIGALQSFALIIVMTSGGPANATNVAGFEMYQQAFRFGSWGVASAMALVLFAVIFVITLLQLWFFRRKGEETS